MADFRDANLLVIGASGEFGMRVLEEAASRGTK